MNLSAQEFFPIPVDTTSVWRVYWGYNNEICVFHNNSIYYINGTEIKNGKEYYKIYEEGHHWETSVNPMNPCNGSSYDYSGRFRGGVRTENGKTYGYSDWYSPGLLMDFTLNVGDTLFSNICYYGKIIESIDSVLVGDQYRKRFNFDGWYCTWMIEGIGHEQGLFESMDEPFENFSDLICYGENYTPIFGNQNCDITVGLLENSSSINRLLIYPNPTSGNLLLNASELNVKIKSYLITDIYGNTLLYKKEVLNQDDMKINIEKYESGIYLLIVTLFNNEKLIGKIIKK